MCSHRLTLLSIVLCPDEKLCLYILLLGIVGSGLRQLSSPDSGLLQFANANPTSSEQLDEKRIEMPLMAKKHPPSMFYTLVEYFAKKNHLFA